MKANRYLKYQLFSFNLSSTATLSLFCLFLILLIFWNSLIVFITIEQLEQRDFSRFFYSALAFLNGKNMYGESPATLIHWSGLFAEHLWNLNPPSFHLLLLPLTSLSLESAFTVWAVISIVAFFISARIIVREIFPSLTPYQVRFGVLGLLAFAGTGALLHTGQLSILLLLPFTLAWKNARNGRWRLAGFYLGLLSSIKLFFLIFIPYFILCHGFRFILSFLGTFIAVFGLGLFIFGAGTHLSWIHVLGEVDWTWSWINSSIHGFLRRVFTETPVFSPAMIAPEMVTPLCLILGAIVGGITLLITTRDRSRHAIDRAFALLTLAALLISPAGWIYYLFFSIGPIVSLAKSWESLSAGGFPNDHHPAYGIRNVLLILALPGFLVPIYFVPLFQPNPWATVLIGSIYFWCTLFLWLGLIIDGLVLAIQPHSRTSLWYQVPLHNMFLKSDLPTGNLSKTKVLSS